MNLLFPSLLLHVVLFYSFHLLTFPFGTLLPKSSPPAVIAEYLHWLPAHLDILRHRPLATTSKAALGGQLLPPYPFCSPAPALRPPPLAPYLPFQHG